MGEVSKADDLRALELRCGRSQAHILWGRHQLEVGAPGGSWTFRALRRIYLYISTGSRARPPSSRPFRSRANIGAVFATQAAKQKTSRMQKLIVALAL